MGNRLMTTKYIIWGVKIKLFKNKSVRPAFIYSGERENLKTLEKKK